MGAQLNELKNSLFVWMLSFITLAVILFPFSLTIFQKIYSDLVPNNINLLIINPLNPFLIQIELALFFAFMLSLPILSLRIINYISPALYPNEERLIYKSLIPTLLLFVSGCVFAYFVLIPLTLKVMNSYNSVLKATVYFEVNQFMTFALFAILFTGVAFILPIFMRILSSLKLVGKSAWIKNFRFSLIAIIVLSAIITPDGTGVTMLILSLPLILLYLLGCFLSKERSEMSSPARQAWPTT